MHSSRCKIYSVFPKVLLVRDAERFGKENIMDNKKSTKNVGLFGGIKNFARNEAERRRGERGALFYDIAVIGAALFFCNLLWRFFQWLKKHTV